MQSNTLCAPQFRMPGGALDIYAYVDNETPEEEHTKKIIAGLDCWIAGLLAVEQLLTFLHADAKNVHKGSLIILKEHSPSVNNIIYAICM